MGKKLLRVVGKTPDDKLVVRGVFRFYETHGLPLDMIVDKLDREGFMPDWLDFAKEAVKAGWRPAAVLPRLTALIGDVYGPKFREGWEQRIRETR